MYRMSKIISVSSWIPGNHDYYVGGWKQYSAVKNAITCVRV